MEFLRSFLRRLGNQCWRQREMSAVFSRLDQCCVSNNQLLILMNFFCLV